MPFGRPSVVDRTGGRPRLSAKEVMRGTYVVEDDVSDMDRGRTSRPGTARDGTGVSNIYCIISGAGGRASQSSEHCQSIQIIAMTKSQSVTLISVLLSDYFLVPSRMVAPLVALVSETICVPNL
jgi:hypothetical protein